MSDITELRIEGMHCAACVATVENALRKTNGVEDVIINLTMGSAVSYTHLTLPTTPYV